MTNKKDKSDKQKREKKPVEDDVSDDDDEEEEEEEEVMESEAKRKKRERGRASFMMLLRRGLAMVSLGMVFFMNQPFMKRERSPGQNGFKMKPLEVGIAGAVHWAKDSPLFLKNPQYHDYLNATARVFLTPREYLEAQSSKRAMPKEQTWEGAYKKAEAKFKRIVDKDTQVLEMLKLPLAAPNMVLIGSYAVIVGVLLCPLVAGLFEYVIVLGCVLIMQGGRGFGMEAQPELYVAGGAAVLCLLVSEAAAPKPAPKKKKRR